ncbi:MAG: hypothetical protein V4599_12425 [Verrucomicrobiota bacterium]
MLVAQAANEVKLGKAGLKTETALENDFNGLTIRLFVGDASLWVLARQYPRIQTKLKIAPSFYQQLDPAYTEAFSNLRVPPSRLTNDEKSSASVLIFDEERFHRASQARGFIRQIVPSDCLKLFCR